MEKSTTGSIDAVRGVCDVNVFDAERVGRARNMVFVSLSAMTAKMFSHSRTFHEMILHFYSDCLLFVT
jgi:hypothetical protein